LGHPQILKIKFIFPIKIFRLFKTLGSIAAPYSFTIEFSNREELSLFAGCEELKDPSINQSNNGNTLTVTVADTKSGGHFLIDLLSE